MEGERKRGGGREKGGRRDKTRGVVEKGRGEEMDI